MHKNLARAAALAAALLSPFHTPAQTTNAPLRVGFVYVSPVGEAGWSYQHDLGRREMERALGAKVTTTVVEAVAEGARATGARRAPQPGLFFRRGRVAVRTASGDGERESEGECCAARHDTAQFQRCECRPCAHVCIELALQPLVDVIPE